MSKPDRKRLSRQGSLGQRGVNLIERIVLEMGSRWTPSGANEVGIDGYIEFFDPGTGMSLGKTVAVQSKAVTSFQNDDGTAFDFFCDRRDLEYWLSGNIPVVLIVSCPDTSEAYWISVQLYFAAFDGKSSPKVHFSKQSCAFSPRVVSLLLDLARSPDDGLYLAPAPRPESLISNLLALRSFPSHVYLAETNHRDARTVWAALAASRCQYDGSWLLHDQRVLSFHDLTEPPWTQICDRGTVEPFGSDEWADADDPDQQRVFVQLLNLTLRSQLGPDVRYWASDDCYAFVGSLEDGTRRRRYRSLKQSSTMSFVRQYSRTTRDGRTFEWLRHLAFRGRFLRLEGRWYLEITPTYRFTKDGVMRDRFHQERLRGIKRLERNRSVLSGLLFWANHLRRSRELFDRAVLALEFEDLLQFNVPTGIDDAAWEAKDDTIPETAGDLAGDSLFDLELLE